VSDLTPTGPVVDLLGMIAYAELLAFDRLADDAKLAPDVSRRAVLSEMAASEILNYRRIAARLTALGADPEAPWRRSGSRWTTITTRPSPARGWRR
jgi:hypothetical protein